MVLLHLPLGPSVSHGIVFLLKSLLLVGFIVVLLLEFLHLGLRVVLDVPRSVKFEVETSYVGHHGGHVLVDGAHEIDGVHVAHAVRVVDHSLNNVE